MYVHHFATTHPKEHTMNIHPVHYAPHHNEHRPICGERHVNEGGEHQLVLVTMDRDSITCFKCIDQYEERTMTPEQIEALSQVRDDIDALFAEIEERLVFDQGKRVTLRVIGHMLKDTPWWNLRRRAQLHAAYRDLAAFKLSDVKGKR